MAQVRPEKQVMRQLWLDIAEKVADESRGKEPLYLTLPGAEGLDIASFIERGLIRTTENGGIHEQDTDLIVAVESDRSAYLAVKKQYPGLVVLEERFENVLQGKSSLRYPTGRHLNAAKARIVNLDLNEPLGAKVRPDGGLAIELMAILAKLAQLHAEPEGRRWWLFLTLHGEVTWDVKTCTLISQYLQQNLERSSKYTTCLTSLVGADLVGKLKQGTPVNFKRLAGDIQQKIIMALVPKRIAFATHQQGWRIETAENIRYGGVLQRAPMTSWMLEFIPDASTSVNPQAAYLASVESSIVRTRHILEDGETIVECHDVED